MQKTLTLLILLTIGCMTLSAQNNVGIGTLTPNPKAVLHLDATDKGFIAPRMTTAQRLAIATTIIEDGLMVFDTDIDCFIAGNADVELSLD